MSLGKKICPITGSDEIIIHFIEPEVLVLTQRKNKDGKYEKVMKPRKEVKNALLPRVSCASQGHTLVDVPEPLRTQLWNERKVW